KQKSQRLLIHALLKKQDKAAARHVFAAMERENPTASLTEDARQELGIGRKESARLISFKEAGIHFTWAPLWERAAFFMAPMAIAITIAQFTGMEPSLLMFAGMLGIIQVVFGAVFLALHRGKAIAVPVFITAINIVIPFLVPITQNSSLNAVLAVFLIAFAVHAGTNLLVFAVNEIYGRKMFSYGTIPLVSQPAGESMKKVMIGITGSFSEDAVEKLRPQYRDIDFVALGPVSGEDARAKLESMPGDAYIRLVLDLGDVETTVRQAGSVVGLANIQSFVMTYPYVAGLTENNISRLNKGTLIEIMTIVQASLPQARSMDLANIFSSIESSIPRKPDGYDESINALISQSQTIAPTDDNIDEWVATYVGVLGRYGDAKVDIAEKRLIKGYLDALQYNLTAYLAGKNPAEMMEILSRHEAAAAAVYWEGRASPAEFMTKMVDEIDARMQAQPLDIAVAAFEDTMLVGKALDDFMGLRDALASRPDSHVKIVVFGKGASSSAPLPSGVAYVQRKGEEVIADLVKQKQEFRAKNIASVSVAMTKGPSDSMKDIAKDLQENKESGASYVIADKKTFVKNVGEINIASLMRSVTIGRPCLIAFGEFRPDAFEDIEKAITALGGFFLITDVAKAISQIFQSIKAVSISA
ncbi:MAG TPA: hypothetical protein PLV52_03635, partial [Candidatus Omnitrophota bacterium]|nr:hypothetical protein [Candidatus Omnitrophota bacterium]